MERKEERREEKTGKFSRNPRMFRRTVRASKNCICDQLPKNKNLQVSWNKSSGKYKLIVK